jgi:hypothetical protein
MKKGVFLPVLLLAFGSLTVQADGDSCGTVRLDAGKGSMAQVPMTDQGGMDNCYAHTATEMVDAYRFSHGDTDYDHKTDALAAAVLYADANGKKSINIGMAKGTIERLVKHGSCRRPNETKVWDQSCKKSSFSDLYADLKVKYKDVEAAMSPYGYGNEKDCLTDSKSKIESCTARVKEVTDTYCTEAKRLELPKLEVAFEKYFDAPKERVLAVLDSNFSGKESEKIQPVGIYYCIQLLKNADYRGREEITEDRSKTRFTSDCKKNLHVSTIIGRRHCPGKTAEYLIRNSWGVDCQKYLKIVDGKAVSNWPCEEGSLWVSADALKYNVTRTEVIQSPSVSKN